MEHSDEYDFNHSFSLQMTIHPIMAPQDGTESGTHPDIHPGARSRAPEPKTMAGAGAGAGVQVLAVKDGLFRLEMTAGLRIRWAVQFKPAASLDTRTGTRTSTSTRSTWANATSQVAVKPGLAYVLKATVSNGQARIHLCELVDANVGTTARPHLLANRCDMVEVGASNTVGANARLARTNTSIVFGGGGGGGGGCGSGGDSGRGNDLSRTGSRANGCGCGTSTATVAGGDVAECMGGYTGALEEIYLSKRDTSSWSMLAWNSPDTGVENAYAHPDIPVPCQPCL